MKNIRTITMIALLLAIAAGTKGQVRRDRAEKASDKNEILTGKEQLERDRVELREFRLLVDAYHQALSARQLKKIRESEKALVKAMKRELLQNRRKTGQDSREAKRGGAERASSARDIRQSRRDLAAPGHDPGDVRDLRDDRRDRRDDRRDQRDDVQDLKSRSYRLKQQQDLHDQFVKATVGAKGEEQQQDIRKILASFTGTMEADIAATKAEIGEDRRELREDRRETREDRRERRERR